jgi:hypothetical protein
MVSWMQWKISLNFLLILKDIDKNGRVDAKEMEQIVTVCINGELSC